MATRFSTKCVDCVTNSTAVAHSFRETIKLEHDLPTASLHHGNSDLQEHASGLFPACAAELPRA